MTSDDQSKWNGLLEDALLAAQAHRRIPSTTYRLQMHAGFTLSDALTTIPYLHRLGISHLYMSSILTARPGSLHGYDVMNHAHLNPELGTEEDLNAVVTELRSRGMGLVLDIVPNHMWVGEGNEWWMDVLENGPSSRFAGYFDIAWENHPRERLHGKVLLPILDEPYGKAIQAGRFRPYFEQGRFGVTMDQTRLPLDPRTYGVFLDPTLEALRTEQGDEAGEVLELQSILAAVRHLAPRDEADSVKVSESLSEILVIKRRLRELAEKYPKVEACLNSVVDHLAGTHDQPPTFSPLIELLDAQPYRPCFWRVALDEINYRRFFEINGLAALAAERSDVFDAIHVKTFEWLQKGMVDGLRVDHVDGLYNPKEYLDRLQNSFVLKCAEPLWRTKHEQTSDETWEAVAAELQTLLQSGERVTEPAVFVVVEKILGARETLPANWLCDGTTGYEFLNEVNGLFVDSESTDRMTEIYQRFTGKIESFDQIAYEKKLEILHSTMASELHVLAHRLDQLAQMEWWSQDFTLNGLRQALQQMIACFPVYRSYVFEKPGTSDRIAILAAARRARSMRAYLGREIFTFISDTLLLRDPPGSAVSDEYKECRRQFVGKFQQLTSPVMAKGVEDTSFYVFNRLLSLNDVGGDPSKSGRTKQELHEFLMNRAANGRCGLSPLSTHDTKRSEDSRARINVLCEIPDEWERRIDRWRGLNQQFKVQIDEGLIAPDDNEEYFLYQTLIGAWQGECRSSKIDEAFVGRIQAYLTKALREAKVHSSWIHPESKYEEAVSAFVASILNDGMSSSFLDDLHNFQGRINPIAKLNSLSQTLIRCTAPGIPDTYQGTESWDYSLVDPDNRHKVDYTSRIQMLEKLERLDALDVSSRVELIRQEFQSASAKLFITSRALQLRRKDATLFETGEYVPLETSGVHADHLFSFLIGNGAAGLIVAVPRLVAKLTAHDNSTNRGNAPGINANLHVPENWSNRLWTNVFTGEFVRVQDGTIPATELFATLPFGLLRTSSEDLMQR